MIVKIPSTPPVHKLHRRKSFQRNEEKGGEPIRPREWKNSTNQEQTLQKTYPSYLLAVFHCAAAGSGPRESCRPWHWAAASAASNFRSRALFQLGRRRLLCPLRFPLRSLSSACHHCWLLSHWAAMQNSWWFWCVNQPPGCRIKGAFVLLLFTRDAPLFIYGWITGLLRPFLYTNTNIRNSCTQFYVVLLSSNNLPRTITWQGEGGGRRCWLVGRYGFLCRRTALGLINRIKMQLNEQPADDYSIRWTFII